MSVSEHTKKLAGNIREQISKHGVTYTDLSDLLDVASYAIDKEEDSGWGLKVTKYIKECCQYGIKHKIDILQLDALEWKVLKCEAPYLFEPFLFYMEKNRRPKKRFYEPRQKHFMLWYRIFKIWKMVFWIFWESVCHRE